MHDYIQPQYGVKKNAYVGVRMKSSAVAHPVVYSPTFNLCFAPIDCWEGSGGKEGPV